MNRHAQPNIPPTGPVIKRIDPQNLRLDQKKILVMPLSSFILYSFH